MTTMEDDFATPSAALGDEFKPAAHVGELLLIDVVEHVETMTTEFGETRPIRCNIAVLDGEHKGDVAHDTMLFGIALVNSLKGNVGKKVLGRLGQGVAKPGRSAPWILDDPTDDDKTTARKYLSYIAEQTKTEAPF